MNGAATEADANLVVHMTWVQRRLAGGRVTEDGELVVSDSGIACDTFNFVCRARLARATARGRIAAVRAYFASVGRPFSWWVGPEDTPPDLGDALVAEGLVPAESEVAMAADLPSLRAAGPEPESFRIARVTTAAQVGDFARINAANWSPPDANVVLFYQRAAPLLLRTDCPLHLYVGYVGDEPVATAELTVSDGAVGLYNISTLAGWRRRGFGSAMTLRPLLDASADGHRVAVLQASADGQGVYARLGFRRTGRYTEYQPPAG